MRSRGSTTEAEARVRRLMGPADPVSGESAADGAVLDRSSPPIRTCAAVAPAGTVHPGGAGRSW
ncbi:hypothetical protein ACIRU3_10430 [Streptomyces sp. NPDC101151]|uniref:hypothetical protein n=1 Tax=Streptomyces sp. NPDC101151 TaxID=3366115 RepID=UPI00380D1F0B